jgi:hypothetical protein
MKTRHLIILTVFVLALIVVGPVSAYTISVSSGINDNYKSSKFLSYTSAMKSSKYQPGTFDSVGTNSLGSQGSVSAFSKGSYQYDNALIEFKQSVSVNGIIAKFDYSANWESGIKR